MEVLMWIQVIAEAALIVTIAFGVICIAHIKIQEHRIARMEQERDEIYRRETKPRTYIEPEVLFPESKTEHTCGKCCYYRETVYDGKTYCHCGKKMEMQMGEHGYARPVFFLKLPDTEACGSFQEEDRRKENKKMSGRYTPLKIWEQIQIPKEAEEKVN